MAEPAGAKNAYVCPACGGQIITVNLVSGVTPMLLACRATPDCEGTMASQWYPAWANDRAPTHEWYRQKIKRRMSEDMKDHILMGGLSIRPVTRPAEVSP